MLSQIFLTFCRFGADAHPKVNLIYCFNPYLSVNSLEKKCVGGILLSRISYVKEEYGKEGMERLWKRMKEIGYSGPTDEKDIKIAKMYPMSYNILFLKAYRELFGEKAFVRLARAAPKKKGFVGMFLKWAGTPGMLAKKAGYYWKEMYNFGELKGEITGKNSVSIKGVDVSPDPVFCDFLTEYFIGVMENTKVKNIECEHVRCIHRGDKKCEWVLTWGKEKQKK